MVRGLTSTGYMVIKVGWIRCSSTLWSKVAYRAFRAVCLPQRAGQRLLRAERSHRPAGPFPEAGGAAGTRRRRDRNDGRGFPERPGIRHAPHGRHGHGHRPLRHDAHRHRYHPRGHPVPHNEAHQRGLKRKTLEPQRVFRFYNSIKTRI